MYRFVSPFTALAVLSACAVGNPSTVTERDIDRAFAEASRIQALPITEPDELPSGTLTYDGQIGADISGDINGSLLADMTMVVGFSTNRISGGVTNINLIEPNGDPDQRLNGTLEIAGFESAGDLDALALGTVSGVDDGFVFETELAIDLEGEVRNDLINGDAIAGTADGAAIGGADFDVEGVFFGTER